MSAKCLVNVVLVCVTILALNGAGHAAVIGTATLVKDPGNGVPFASPDAALGSPWVSYVLNLQTTAGELIGGVDANFTGTFHQRWIYNVDTDTFNPTANSSNTSNGDTHLIAPAQIGFNEPNENNTGVGSPLADTAEFNYGLGTQLKGTWGYSPIISSTNIAYLVVPKNQLQGIDLRVDVANREGDIIGRLTERDFFPNVPEPTSCWLLCAGLLAYAAASRRFCHRIQ